MKDLLKKETTRVTKAFEYVRSKLNVDLTLLVGPMTPGMLKKHQGTHFTIERSHRNTHDKNTFIIYYNQTVTLEMTLVKLKRHAFHEILHALTWPFIDEYFSVIKYIKDPKLYTELAERAEDTRENVTYLLERKLGPFVLPQCDWSKEE